MELNSPLSEINSVGTAALRPASEEQPPTAKSVAAWFAYVAPDFTQSNIHTIAGARKLIEAKKALKGSKGSKGSFGQLIEDLGLDLGKAERLMKVARHPILANSAHAPVLPTSWMTLYTLSFLPPQKLEALIGDGKVHLRLERREAEQLVRRHRNSNGHHDDGDRSEDRDRGDDVVDCSDQHEDDRASECDLGRGAIDSVSPTEPTQTTREETIGPNSRGEFERISARCEELEREKCQWEIQRSSYDNEVEELRAKLGPETTLRHPRRLFRRALETLRKSDAPKLLEKDRRALVHDAVTDLLELVRSLQRDELKIDRLDLFYRAELH